MREFLLIFVVSTSLLAADSKTEFRDLVGRYWAAWSTGNPDNAGVFYAKDADLVFYDVAPLQYHGWNEYRDGFKQAFADIASIKVEPNDDLVVRVRGNTAITNGTAKGTETFKNGKTVLLNLRHTAVWEKRDGKWYIVHEHVSAPLE